MARRPKEIPIEQKILQTENQIKNIDLSIAETEQALSNMYGQKEQLLRELEEQKICLLINTIKIKNISIDKAKEILENVN